MSRSPVSASAPKAHVKRTRVPRDLLTDVICCWLISVGVLLAMRQLFRFENPIIDMMLRTAVILAINVLLTRRWWMLPAALAATFALILLFAGLTGSLKALIAYFTGFFDWWINQFPMASRYERPSTIALVNWILAILVSTIVFLFVRRIRFFPIILMVSAALFLIIGINDFHENLGGLAFIAAGSLPLLARNYHQHLAQKIDDILISPRKIMIPGLIVCILFSLIAHQIVPSNTYPWKNKALSNWINDIKISREKKGDEIFSLQSSGLQPNADRLGGNLTQDHKPALIVETDRPFLMKGMVYDTYTGKGWTNSNARVNYKMGSESIDALSDVFNLQLPKVFNKVHDFNPIADVMPTADTTVTLLSEEKTIFTSGRVKTVTPISENADIFFNSRSEVFSDKFLPKKFKYSFESTLLNRQANNIPNRISEIEMAAGIEYPDQIYKQYTALPDTLPSSIRDKAKEITHGIVSPYAQMEAVENYLKANYAYTLRPGDVPIEEDFVDYFLKSGKGYCVYYASAMCVMARTLDIPSRFVIGYGLKQSGGNWMAYSDTAHAWVECYIPGTGWVTFDPTASTGYSSYNVSNQVATHAPTQTQTTTQTEMTTTTSPSYMTSESTQNTAPDKPIGTSVSIRWVYILLSAALILLLAFAILRMIRQSKAYTPERMHERYPDNGVCADQYYSDILRQLSLLGFAPQTGETIYQHGRWVGDAFSTFSPEESKSDGSLLENAFEIIMNWRYGEMKPSDSELEQLSQSHDMLEKRIKNKLNKIQYALIRLLFAK